MWILRFAHLVCRVRPEDMVDERRANESRAPRHQYVANLMARSRLKLGHCRLRHPKLFSTMCSLPLDLHGTWESVLFLTTKQFHHTSLNLPLGNQAEDQPSWMHRASIRASTTDRTSLQSRTTQARTAVHVHSRPMTWEGERGEFYFCIII